MVFAGKPHRGIGFPAFSDSRFGRFLIRFSEGFRLGDAMAQPRDDRQKELFRPALDQIIDLGHPLVRLRNAHFLR
jgi:hypothetical protein